MSQWCHSSHGQGRFHRVFKTHCWYTHVPKGARYIVVVRDPKDVAVSFFKFIQGWFFEPGAVTLDQFVREFWLSRSQPESPMQNASYFHHLLSWWQQRENPGVLWLFYEDLKEDLPREVLRIADFMGYPPGADRDARVAVATRHATFSFMKEHASHFDEKLSKLARNAACGLRPEAGLQGTSGKVNKGEVGAGRASLSTALTVDIDHQWLEVVTPATGFRSYDELRLTWRQDHDRR